MSGDSFFREPVRGVPVPLTPAAAPGVSISAPIGVPDPDAGPECPRCHNILKPGDPVVFMEDGPGHLACPDQVSENVNVLQNEPGPEVSGDEVGKTPVPVPIGDQDA